MNPRITKKERGLIRGAVRRVFSRSELRKSVMEAGPIVKHTDPKRPRVTKWILCDVCKGPTPRWEAQCDHREPVQKVTETEEELGFDVFLSRLWCEPSNLQKICKPCHHEKSKRENALRRKNKKGRKRNEGSKATTRSDSATGPRGTHRRDGEGYHD